MLIPGYRGYSDILAQRTEALEYSPANLASAEVSTLQVADLPPQCEGSNVCSFAFSSQARVQIDLIEVSLLILVGPRHLTTLLLH